MERTLLNFTDIICISGICYENGYHSFEVVLDSGVHRFFSYTSQNQACTARNAIIGRMTEYWGRDQVLMPNGIENEIAIHNAIVDITKIWKKDSFAAFTVMVSDAFTPLHFVFCDFNIAESYHQNLQALLESNRRDHANQVTVANCL
ncbi:hypothetical protein [Desulfosarcina ovata]|uniref:hypothetical protein n=1 Tax=Desulfosarcina ovata TaxID=83564 RepID=UPI0012D2EBCC|nr:hypothetical protein [Desulfosarcina ovata]